MPDQTDADRLIAYMERQKQRERQREGFLISLVIAVLVAGFVAYLVGGWLTSVEITVLGFIVAIVAGIVYESRHR